MGNKIKQNSTRKDSRAQSHEKSVSTSKGLSTTEIIDNLKLRQAELEKENNYLREELGLVSIILESQEGMLITDSKSRILRVNQAYLDLSGYNFEEIVGNQPSVFHTGLYQESFYQDIRDTLKKNGFWQGDIRDRRKDGQIYVQRLNISVIKSMDDIVTHYVASFTDNTHEKELADKVHQLAYYDPLTDLPNRRLFQNRLEKAMLVSETTQTHGALLYIDLDHFKTLNDTLGHDLGDLLLQQVAKRLLACMRKTDTVARIGGDEFVIILEELCTDIKETEIQVRLVGEKIINTLNKKYQIRNHEYVTTSSIGITLFNANNKAVDELLKQADIAMYAAKAAGRNGFLFFSPEMETTIITNNQLKTSLIRAVEELQFTLHFQVQVSHNYQPIGAEALLRWQHPEYGLVSPREFIALAEQSRLIVPIGFWVLESACAQLKRWENFPFTKHLHIAVNISAHQFQEDSFVDQLSGLLEKYSIKANLLKLEFTESLLLGNVEEIIIKMHKLIKIGVSFSIDDFGTGYSSLAYLTRLPFDQLKIDQSFVRNIGINSSDMVMVQTIIGMAKNLGISVIAEGVETEQQRIFLELNGCPAIQGFLAGIPKPIEQFELELKQNWDRLD